MGTLKLITFDVTGTLLGLRHTVGHQYAKVALTYGINAPPERLNENFKIFFNKLSLKHPNFGLNSVGWKLWWRELVSRFFVEAAPKGTIVKSEVVDQISSDLIELYKTGECWRLMDGTLNLLQELRDKKKCLGVISNYDPRLFDILKNLKVNDYFDFVLTSYNTKCAKPDLKIFKVAEEKNINAQKNEILHIGDNPELDFLGAKNAGWNALLVTQNPGKVIEKYPQIEESWIVDSVCKINRTLSYKQLL